jgi:hypothetical protein
VLGSGYRKQLVGDFESLKGLAPLVQALLGVDVNVRNLTFDWYAVGEQNERELLRHAWESKCQIILIDSIE